MMRRAQLLNYATLSHRSATTQLNQRLSFDRSAIFTQRRVCGAQTLRLRRPTPPASTEA